MVVGNITVGGTGKTPIVIWLAKSLRNMGWSPGIVSRGYRGTVGAHPVAATADSDPAVVGDEPIMIAAESRCRVVVHPDRVAAVRMLVAGGANVDHCRRWPAALPPGKGRGDCGGRRGAGIGQRHAAAIRSVTRTRKPAGEPWTACSCRYRTRTPRRSMCPPQVTARRFRLQCGDSKQPRWLLP